MDLNLKKDYQSDNASQITRKSPQNPFEITREQQQLQLQHLQQQQNQLYGMGYNGMNMPSMALNNSMGLSPYMNSPMMGGMAIPMNMQQQQHLNANIPLLFPPNQLPNSQHGIPPYLVNSGTSSPNMTNELMDPIRSHRNSFDALSDYNFRIQQMAMAQQQQQQVMQQQQQQQQSNFRNEKMDPSINQKNALGSSIGNSSAEERYQQLMEKEAKWSEVRKYSDLIRRFATDAVNVEITKENYYDLYNMAVCLLRSVDSLDPDKTHSMIHLSQRKSNEVAIPGGLNNGNFLAPTSTSTAGLQQADLEFLQARKSFDVYFSGRGSVDGSYMPKFSADYSHLFSLGNGNGLAPPVNIPTSNPLPNGNGNSVVKTEYSNPINNNNNINNNKSTPSPHESHDDNDQQEEKRTNKRRRRRTVYSSRRNLHCHMCGVTETPEWRRGPAGDHTLCNACGLHWAKSQKKKPATSEVPSSNAKSPPPEGRKHSIDMILNASRSLD
eukprot:TRINITY_DN2116_c0_g1_i5.p2 TRINITY_DN2116_c0_g1~~TRINITY_DN2116_c0_g1_i5.p2  ORF type:complete len:495 (+),score=181.03 TRINITY_DN2116_c0_g1_i5:366-1850(+)